MVVDLASRMAHLLDEAAGWRGRLSGFIW